MCNHKKSEILLKPKGCQKIHGEISYNLDFLKRNYISPRNLH